MPDHPELGPLKRGDHVGLVSTSTPPTAELYGRSLDLVESWGLIPVPGKHVREIHPRAKYLAGTDEHRAADLMEAYTDDSLAAVFCLRGGYGSMRILDLLDMDSLRAARPKALIGSSDVTGLHEFWQQNLGLATWFAPMLATNDLLQSPDNIAALKKALFSGWRGHVLTASAAVSIVQGEASGTVTGGNLSLLRMARETGNFPVLQRQGAAGKIVLLEDVDEEPWRLDGHLLTLLRSGYFDGAAGIALGTWDKCGEPDEVRTVLEDWLAPLKVPLIYGLPFGHGGPVETIPLGVRARIVADGTYPRIEFG